MSGRGCRARPHVVHQPGHGTRSGASITRPSRWAPARASSGSGGNQLAGPYLLGVSSGASLGAALVITLDLGSLVGTVTLTAGAFTGAVLALVLVLGVLGGRRGLSSRRLVLAGLTVGYFLAAVTNMVVVLADSRDAVRAVTFWMLGSLGQAAWGDVPVLGALALATTGALVLWARRLGAIGLGDDVARSLGVDPDRLRRRAP